jgi:hypothetical protein
MQIKNNSPCFESMYIKKMYNQTFNDQLIIISRCNFKKIEKSILIHNIDILVINMYNSIIHKINNIK